MLNPMKLQSVKHNMYNYCQNVRKCQINWKYKIKEIMYIEPNLLLLKGNDCKTKKKKNILENFQCTI